MDVYEMMAQARQARHEVDQLLGDDLRVFCCEDCQEATSRCPDSDYVYCHVMGEFVRADNEECLE